MVFSVTKHAVSGFFAGKKYVDDMEFDSVESAEAWKKEKNDNPKEPIKILDIKLKN